MPSKIADDPLLDEVKRLREEVANLRVEQQAIVSSQEGLGEQLVQSVSEVTAATARTVAASPEKLIEVQKRVLQRLDALTEELHHRKLAVTPRKGTVQIVWPAGLNGGVTLNSVRIGPFPAGSIQNVPGWVVEILKQRDDSLAEAGARSAALQANPCLGNFNR